MEILRLSGYIQEEKVEIAMKYLVPRNRKAMGLSAGDVQFTKESIAQMSNAYAREAGVRSLENNIKKILRKVALTIAKKSSNEKQKKSEKVLIASSNLKDYLGKPIFTGDLYFEKMPIGVTTGLAWTSLGGVTLCVESVFFDYEKTEMKLTGQAGDVMKESAQIAWSYLHSRQNYYAPGIPFFEKKQVHVHIPEGATPKDGPSAGVTMLTSLISLLIQKPVIDKMAMTGELTLTGKVLPIGGLKEKLIAARRSGIKILIFPEKNLRDYEELPDYLKKGLNVHFVDHYDEVFHIAFPDAKINGEEINHEKVKKIEEEKLAAAKTKRKNQRKTSSQKSETKNKKKRSKKQVKVEKDRVKN
jgi:ATP-dependent Lon protease